MRLVMMWLAASLLSLSLPAWSLDAETQAAKDEGMRGYNRMMG